MKVNFVMNNGAVIRGKIKVHTCMGAPVSLKQYLKETGEYIQMTGATIDFVGDKYDSQTREITITKKDISFSYKNT